MLKNKLGYVAAILVGALALVSPAPAYAAAPDDPIPIVEEGTVTEATPPVTRAGDYEHICQLTNGTSWSLASGEPTTNCHGSYLQKYIEGNLVANYNLVYDGGATSTPSIVVGVSCMLSIAGAVGLLFWPPSGAVEWVYMSAVGAASLASCPG